MTKYFLLFSLFMIGASASADMKVTELPAGSTIKFVGSLENVPAGWDGVSYGALTFKFSKPLKNILNLSGSTLQTSEVGSYSEIPCRAHSDSSRGIVGICFQNFQYVVSLSHPTINKLVVPDVDQDCDGNKIKSGDLTVEAINKCFKGMIEIVPNTKVVKP